MSLRIFLVLSSLICALFFFYLGQWGLNEPFWQKLFSALQASWELPENQSLNWKLGFKVLALVLGLGNLILYFLGKNWGKGLYLGIFVGLMMLSLLLGTWFISY